MSRPTLPPGYGPNGERLDYDGPPRMPVTVMSVPELLDYAAHIAVTHPDAQVGLCVIHTAEGDDEEER
jgi:hypothetical protein